MRWLSKNSIEKEHVDTPPKPNPRLTFVSTSMPGFFLGLTQAWTRAASSLYVCALSSSRLLARYRIAPLGHPDIQTSEENWQRAVQSLSIHVFFAIHSYSFHLGCKQDSLSTSAWDSLLTYHSISALDSGVPVKVGGTIEVHERASQSYCSSTCHGVIKEESCLSDYSTFFWAMEKESKLL